MLHWTWCTFSKVWFVEILLCRFLGSALHTSAQRLENYSPGWSKEKEARFWGRITQSCRVDSWQKGSKIIRAKNETPENAIRVEQGIVSNMESDRNPESRRLHRFHRKGPVICGKELYPRCSVWDYVQDGTCVPSLPQTGSLKKWVTCPLGCASRRTAKLGSGRSVFCEAKVTPPSIT